jgi:AcrR family transcriptional regulator
MPKYHHGNLRDTLLKLALDQISEGGVESLSMRRLAKDAGVSHAAPARHFSSKQDLLTALVASFHDRLIGFMNDYVEEGAPNGGEQELVLMIEATLIWSKQNPAEIQGIMNPDINRFASATIRSKLADRLDLIADAVRRARGHDGPYTGDINTIVIYIFGSALGIASTGANPVFRDSLADTRVDIKAIAAHMASAVRLMFVSEPA